MRGKGRSSHYFLYDYYEGNIGLLECHIYERSSQYTKSSKVRLRNSKWEHQAKQNRDVFKMLSQIDFDPIELFSKFIFMWLFSYELCQARDIKQALNERQPISLHLCNLQARVVKIRVEWETTIS